MKRTLVILAMAACAMLPAGSAAPAHAAERSTAVADVALTSAVLALEEGDAPQAVRLLELAVREGPEDGAARHWLGVALVRMGRYADAVKVLAAVTAHPGTLPAAGRERALEDLSRARALLDAGAGPEAGAAVPLPADLAWREPAAQVPRWERQVGLDVGRDSNPALLPEEVAGGLPLAAGPATATPDEAAGLHLRLRHNAFQDRHGWSFGWSAAGFRSFHRDLRDLDVTFLEAAASLAWGADPRGYAEGPLGPVRVPAEGVGRWTAVVQAGASSARLGGDPYLRTATGAGSLLIRGPGAGATRLDLEVRDRRYDGDGPPPLQRSGTETSLAASRIFPCGGDCSLRLGAGGSRWTAGAAFDGSSVQGVGEITATLPGRWSLILQGVRREDRYAHRASNLWDPLAAARRDATWQVTAAAERPLVPDRLYFTVRGMWVKRGSNAGFPSGAPLFDYRRTVLTTGLVWAF